MKARDEQRDRELDLAWRAANRDEPPAAVDAAIAAAARRAAGAGPVSPHASRAWWPVAAAAVVALVAVGIVEMTPREQLVPTTEGKRKVELESSRLRGELPPADSQSPRTAAKPGNPFPASPSDAKAASGAMSPLDRFSVPPASPAPQEMPATNGGASAAQTPASRPPSVREAVSGRVAGTPAARNQIATPSAPAAVDKPAPEVDAKTGDAEARTIEEWIRTIQRYKAEGRSDLAAKELALFRARYPDRADTLLPPDLREAKP